MPGLSPSPVAGTRRVLGNHRKLIVVDGRIALTGGMNLALPYMGPPGTTDLSRDVAVVVEGPAVADMEDIFASDWKFTTGSEPGTSIPLPRVSNDSRRKRGHLQVVASGPDVAGDPLYESLLALIFSAQADLDRHALLRARRNARPRLALAARRGSTCDSSCRPGPTISRPTLPGPAICATSTLRGTCAPLFAGDAPRQGSPLR